MSDAIRRGWGNVGERRGAPVLRVPRAILTARLKALELQIGFLVAHIEAQAELLESERARGSDTSVTTATITLLKGALTTHEAERDKQRAELTALVEAETPP